MNINQTIILRGFVSKEFHIYSLFVGKNAKEAKVGNFTLAIQNGKDSADFLPITVFSPTCDLIERFTQVGTQLLIRCNLRNNVYKKKDGEDTLYCGGIQIICEEFQVLSQPTKKIEENLKKGNKKEKTV